MMRTIQAGFFLSLICLGIPFGYLGQRDCVAVASSLTVAMDRWLEVRGFTGTVFIEIDSRRSRVQAGVRLWAAGDTLQTMRGSTATVAVDTGAGFISLAENTTLRIKKLEMLSDGGRLTHLQVLSGQVQLNIPSFTNPSSELEVETPAGWSGVRGTEFGIAVRPDGTTSVATLTGEIETSAQQQSVAIVDGFQSLVVVGDPPLPPVPITENTQLTIRRMERIGRTVHLVGSIDPVNLLLVDGISQSIESSGDFDITLLASESPTVAVVVITPLGKRQKYELALD